MDLEEVMEIYSNCLKQKEHILEGFVVVSQNSRAGMAAGLMRNVTRT